MSAERATRGRMQRASGRLAKRVRGEPDNSLRRIPSIQCLLTFEALARLRSTTQAARELCVTPSAVSHRIEKLERQLGIKLFWRMPYELTADGHEYLLHVRQALIVLARLPSTSVAMPSE